MKGGVIMLIPKNLFASMEAAQRLINNPNIQRIQLVMNNIHKLQEVVNISEFQSVNLINQQMSFANLTNLNILAKQINFPIVHRQFESISSNFKILSEVYLKNHNYWNNVINSAIGAYNSTQEEEFEVVIENFPVIIVKTNLQEYFEKFRSLKIPDSIAVKLSFITYFILEFAPVIYVIPALIPFVQFLLKLFIIYGKPYIKALSKFQDPDVFSEKLADNTFSALFGSVITILGTLFMTKKK